VGGPSLPEGLSDRSTGLIPKRARLGPHQLPLSNAEHGYIFPALRTIGRSGAELPQRRDVSHSLARLGPAPTTTRRFVLVPLNPPNAAASLSVRGSPARRSTVFRVHGHLGEGQGSGVPGRGLCEGCRGERKPIGATLDGLMPAIDEEPGPSVGSARRGDEQGSAGIGDRPAHGSAPGVGGQGGGHDAGRGPGAGGPRRARGSFRVRDVRTGPEEPADRAEPSHRRGRADPRPEHALVQGRRGVPRGRLELATAALSEVLPKIGPAVRRLRLALAVVATLEVTGLE
jgi:hypothetical protein